MYIVSECGHNWGWGGMKKVPKYKFRIKIYFPTNYWDSVSHFLCSCQSSARIPLNSIPIRAEGSWNLLSQLPLQLWHGRVICSWSLRYRKEVKWFEHRKFYQKQWGVWRAGLFLSCTWKFPVMMGGFALLQPSWKLGKMPSFRKVLTDTFLQSFWYVIKNNILLFKLLCIVGILLFAAESVLMKTAEIYQTSKVPE